MFLIFRYWCRSWRFFDVHSMIRQYKSSSHIWISVLLYIYIYTSSTYLTTRIVSLSFFISSGVSGAFFILFQFRSKWTVCSSRRRYFFSCFNRLALFARVAISFSVRPCRYTKLYLSIYISICISMSVDTSFYAARWSYQRQRSSFRGLNKKLLHRWFSKKNTVLACMTA
jgi:hypothetical protein